MSSLLYVYQQPFANLFAAKLAVASLILLVFAISHFGYGVGHFGEGNSMTYTAWRAEDEKTCRNEAFMVSLSY